MSVGYFEVSNAENKVVEGWMFYIV